MKNDKTEKIEENEESLRKLGNSTEKGNERTENGPGKGLFGKIVCVFPF